MDEFRGENKILLRGRTAGEPALSHQNHGVDYYVIPLRGWGYDFRNLQLCPLTNRGGRV